MASIASAETWGGRLRAFLAGWRPEPGIPRRILQQKVDLMYGRLPAGLAISVIVSTILVFLLPAPDGRRALLAWGAASLALNGVRFADCLNRRRHGRDLAALLRGRRHLVIGAAAQGVLWGVMGWCLFPAVPQVRFFLCLVMTGMAGGGILFLAPVLPAYGLYLVPLMLPPCIHFMAGQLAVEKAAGYLGIGYVLAMLVASAKASQWMDDALGSSLEKEELVGQLKAANQALADQKARLEGEVAERTVSLSLAVDQLQKGLREKEAERQRAAQSDAQHLSLLQAITEGFGHVDADETFCFANRAAETIFGVAPGHLVGRSLLSFLDPAGTTLVLEETGRRQKGEDNRYLCPIIREDGQGRVLEVNASPIFAADGRYVGASAVFEDITERKQAEDALRMALTFNDQIISSAQEGIVVYGPDGRLKSWNRFMEHLTGLPAGAVVGRQPEEVFPFLSEVGVIDGVRKALGGESSVFTCYPWSIPATGRSGWATSVLGPMRGADGEVTGVVETVSDLTELKQAEDLQHKLQAELDHSQKLESIGRLAGGIAHDMNNVLGAVQAIVETLQFKRADDPRLLAELAIIDRASTRGRDLVKGLTNFVRKHLQEPERLNLNDLVREEMAILDRTTFQKVTLAVDLEATLPEVMGERGALGSALMNLCVNAMDAMAGKGSLAVRTWNAGAGEVGLSVADTGKGMAPEVAARAMEPFFTTKAIGKGTGLGLAMVYATVKAHGGSVRIQSEVGRGTMVSIRLPALDRAARPVAKIEPPAGKAGPMRILQVDDDELILASVPLMLEHSGHTVATAAGGQEALDRLAGGLQVDLVILDLNMPGMNGLETLQRLRELRPDLPVLLATGYLDHGTEAVLQRSGRALSITKPFSLAELDASLKKLAAMSGGSGER